MTNNSVFEQLEQLVATFPRDVQLAMQVNSPNCEDDLSVKMAIIGFSYNSRTEDWDLGHFEFTRDHLARHFASTELCEYGPNADNVRLFFALGIGYLLGLYHQRKIHDEDFRLAELRLPGLIMLHLGQLTVRPA